MDVAVRGIYMRIVNQLNIHTYELLIHAWLFSSARNDKHEKWITEKQLESREMKTKQQTLK